MNDVKARLEAVAQAQGKRLAKVLHKLCEAVTATIAAEKKASLSESPHFDYKAAKLAGTNLSPLNWLLAAASCAGAVAALVIVLSFDLLNNSSAAPPQRAHRHFRQAFGFH